MEETTNKSGMSTGMIIGIAVIVAIVFGGGAYAYVNNKAKKEKKDLNAQITELQSQVSSATTATTVPSSSTSAIADATANWKTYSNEEYVYEIKYPQDWKTKERSLMSDLGHRDFVWIQSNGDEFSVDIWDFSFYSYDQLAEPPPGGIDPDTINKKEVIIDGQPAIELSYVAVGDGGLGAREIKKVFIQKNQLLYIISYDSKRGEQILSTFKFIK